MGFLNKALDKAKDTVEVVSHKTGEVIGVQKLKFEIATVENKREKDLRELGRLCFAKYKNSEDIPKEFEKLIAAIKEKSVKISALKTEIAKAQERKVCPDCGAYIDADSNFCRSCGIKVVFDTAEQQNDINEEN